MNVLLYTVVIVCLFYCAVEYKTEISAGVKFAVNYCLNILVPSLFPLMFLSCLAAVSPFCVFINKLMSTFMKKVLKMPSELSCAYVFGLLCGYPVGAKLCSLSLKNGMINKKDAMDFLLYASNPGIAFSVLYVGASVLGNINLGLIMFICGCIGSLVTALFVSLNRKTPKELPHKQKYNSALKIIDISAKNTLSATVNMCLYVVLFSAFTPILYASGAFEIILSFMYYLPYINPIESAALLSFVPDIVSGTVAAINFNAPPYIFLTGLCFGGICVHMQIFSLFTSLNLKLQYILKFYLFRLINIAISLTVFYFWVGFSNNTTSVFSNFSQIKTHATSANTPASICLILLSIFFVYCVCEKTFLNKQ